MTDLLALTRDIVAISSVSHEEAELVAWLEGELAAVPWLTVDRVGLNLVACTQLGRPSRLLLAGHTDTVLPPDDAEVRIEGDTLYGLGASDMKSGLAVMVELARTVDAPAVDVTYVFYAGEEVAAEHNGLGHLFAERPDLLAADAALVGEPTSAALEAGCQGTMRLVVTLAGVRAHSARPWMGRNAIHRLAPLLDAVAAREARQPIIDGCQFRDALQAVNVTGGVSNNVVPDSATVTLNHRFAPDRSPEAAEAEIRELLAAHLDDGDTVEVVDMAPAAAPGLDHPLLAALVQRNDLAVTAKLGWTDVARFASHGIPAANFGPGDPLLAHTVGENVTRAPIEECFGALADLLAAGA